MPRQPVNHDDISLRVAAEKDVLRLLEWRNDPQTRAASIDQARVDEADHRRWFQAALQSPLRRLFIAECGGEPVGSLRVDYHADCWELSWTVAPEARGRGLGRAMVAGLSQRLRGVLCARVRSDNPASARIAAAAGFEPGHEVDGICHYFRPAVATAGLSSDAQGALMNSVVDIGGHQLGEGQPPFIVAEMSGNHDGSLERALEIVDAAADAGAHALKLQTYTADTLTLDHDGPGFRIEDPASPWVGRNLYALYEQAHTPWAWHEAIFDRCRERGLLAFSSPFDATAVDFLERLDPPCYKIASFECVDLPLIRYAASTGRPLIISTGMASRDEIEEAVEAAMSGGCGGLVLLKCTSSYPADASQAHLQTMDDLREWSGCPVGVSDHTLGIGVALAAVARGAVMVEKHLVLSRDAGAVDAAFSLEPAELAQLVEESGRVWQAAGQVRYGPSESEQASLALRRSLYFVTDLQPGDSISSESVRSIRPGLGLPPKHLDEVIGRRVAAAVTYGTPVSWELLE